MNSFFNSRDHREEDDSTWKIVYMDMITMLMILFLSLWIIDRGRNDDRKKHGEVTLNKVEFQADDYFDPGKSQLKPEALGKISEYFFNQKNSFPTPGMDLDNNGRRMVIINGHTDDHGDKGDNLQLGFDRALAVYGILKAKIPTLADNVGICSYADNMPAEQVKFAVPGTSREVWDKLYQANQERRKRNRRFEVIGQFEEVESSAQQ